MERRNWSLEAFSKLKYIDSLEDDIRVSSLRLWSNEYLEDNFLDLIDLDVSDLISFNELFYKSINFLKKYNRQLKDELNINKDIKKFLA
jgi:hypothetical protein